MFLIPDGGPFALFVVAWGLAMVALLAHETRRTPAWFPGLHSGILAVLFGLGTAGWLFGLDMVARAVESASADHVLQLAAMGNSIAPYPLILAGVVAGLAAPWMVWNARWANQTTLVPAPLIRILSWLTGIVIAVSMGLAVASTSLILQGAVLSEAFPREQLHWAPWLALAMVPMGLLTIVLSLVGARRHQRAMKDPLVQHQTQQQQQQRRPAARPIAT